MKIEQKGLTASQYLLKCINGDVWADIFENYRDQYGKGISKQIENIDDIDIIYRDKFFECTITPSDIQYILQIANILKSNKLKNNNNNMLNKMSNMTINELLVVDKYRNNSYVLGVMPNIDSYKHINIFKNMVSKRIQAHGNNNIEKNNRWSHIAMLFFDKDDSQWYVYESHLKDKGVVKRKLLDWWYINKTEKNNRIEIVECNYLNYERAKELEKQKIEYGIKDVKNILITEYITNIPILKIFRDKLNIKNQHGLTCSEYVYTCTKNYYIWDLVNQQYNNIFSKKVSNNTMNFHRILYSDKFLKGTISPSDLQYIYQIANISITPLIT